MCLLFSVFPPYFILSLSYPQTYGYRVMFASVALAFTILFANLHYIFSAEPHYFISFYLVTTPRWTLTRHTGCIGSRFGLCITTFQLGGDFDLPNEHNADSLDWCRDLHLSDGGSGHYHPLPRYGIPILGLGRQWKREGSPSHLWWHPWLDHRQIGELIDSIDTR